MKNQQLLGKFSRLLNGMSEKESATVDSLLNSIQEKREKNDICLNPFLVIDWLRSDQVGMSSKFILDSILKLEDSEYAEPYDWSDFQRCDNLLKTIPELKEHFSIMKSKSNYWSDLVDNWDEISSLIDKKHFSLAHKLINKGQ